MRCTISATRPIGWAREKEDLMNIAFFGAGLMGAGFVRRMLENGHQVNVWNRDPAKAKALEVDGAHAFADPAARSRASSAFICRSSDDASVDSVLEPLAALDPGRDLHRRPHDHGADADRRTDRALGRAGQRLHPCAGVHVPREYARGNWHDARSPAIPAEIAAVLPELETMTRLVDQPRAEAGRRRRLQALRQSGDDRHDGRRRGCRAARPCGRRRAGRRGRDVQAVQSGRAFGRPRRQGRVRSLRAAVLHRRHGAQGRAADDRRSRSATMSRSPLMPSIAALFDEAIARGEGSRDNTAAFRYPAEG